MSDSGNESLFERVIRGIGLQRRRESPPIVMSTMPSGGTQVDLVERIMNEDLARAMRAHGEAYGGMSGFSGFSFASGLSGSSWAPGGTWGMADPATGVRFEGQRGYFGVPGWEGVPGLPEGWPEAKPAEGYKPGERIARVDESTGQVVVDGPEHPTTLYGLSIGDFVVVDSVFPLVSHDKKFIFNKTSGYIKHIIRAGYAWVEIDGQCPCNDDSRERKQLWHSDKGHCHWFPNSVLFLADESTAKFYVRGYL